MCNLLWTPRYTWQIMFKTTLIKNRVKEKVKDSIFLFIIRSLFSAIHDVSLVRLVSDRDDTSSPGADHQLSRTHSCQEISPVDKPGSRVSMMSPHVSSPTKFDKRLTQLQVGRSKLHVCMYVFFIRTRNVDN